MTRSSSSTPTAHALPVRRTRPSTSSGPRRCCPTSPTWRRSPPKPTACSPRAGAGRSPRPSRARAASCASPSPGPTARPTATSSRPEALREALERPGFAAEVWEVGRAALAPRRGPGRRRARRARARASISALLMPDRDARMAEPRAQHRRAAHRPRAGRAAPRPLMPQILARTPQARPRRAHLPIRAKGQYPRALGDDSEVPLSCLEGSSGVPSGEFDCSRRSLWRAKE